MQEQVDSQFNRSEDTPTPKSLSKGTKVGEHVYSKYIDQSTEISLMYITGMSPKAIAKETGVGLRRCTLIAKRTTREAMGLGLNEILQLIRTKLLGLIGRHTAVSKQAMVEFYSLNHRKEDESNLVKRDKLVQLQMGIGQSLLQTDLTLANVLKAMGVAALRDDDEKESHTDTSTNTKLLSDKHIIDVYGAEVKDPLKALRELKASNKRTSDYISQFERELALKKRIRKAKSNVEET